MISSRASAVIKNFFARAIPPIRGSWTMNMGPFEKDWIVRMSEMSFSGDLNAGQVRLHIISYADREPPQVEQSRVQPLELSSIVVGYCLHRRYGTRSSMLWYLKTDLTAKA